MTGGRGDKYPMTLDQITGHNSEATFRLLAEYTIAPRWIAHDLANIENRTRSPGDCILTWQEMIVADPSGEMRPAGEIVAEGRAYMQDRMKEMLHAGRHRMAKQTTVAGR
jgi:hypothetical protein